MDGIETREQSPPPAGTVYDGFISYSHSADDLLAPRLQAGLQRFAKPWWKRRALRIFRDEASLSANPHLWGSIVEAMDQSDWLVLLLSPDAAQSEWVDREVEYWLEHKDPNRILPVVTGGEFAWGDDGIDPASTAAPPALFGAFADEPRWVDLRFADTEEQLDLNNASFRAAVADIASAIRGVPKDELESEEVRQHHRTIRTAWAAAVALLLLVIVAGAAAIFANGQRLEADEQRVAAEDNATEAATQRDVAERQTNIAEELAFEARSDALAASAIAQLDVDAELALLLGIEALSREEQPAALSATHQALQRHRGVFEVSIEPGVNPVFRVGAGGMSPAGDLIALVAPGHDLEMWEVGGTDPLWTAPAPKESSLFFGARFTDDGTALVALVAPADLIDPSSEIDTSSRGSLAIYDARTGDEMRSIALFNCPLTLDPDPLPVYVDLASPLPWAATELCQQFRADVGLMELRHGQLNVVTQVTAGLANYWAQFGVPTVDASKRYLAVASGGPGQVIDLGTGETVLEYDGGISTISSDGSRVLIRGHGVGFALELMRLQDQELLWSFAKTFTRAWFSEDQQQVYGTSPDGSTYVIDAATGELILRLAGQDGVPIAATMSSDGQLLATFTTDLTARVWDLGEVLSEGDVYITHAEPREHVAASADVAGGIAAVWAGLPRQEDQPWQINLIDLSSGELIRTVTGGAPALSNDGSRLAYRALEEVEVTEADLKLRGETGVLPRVGPVRIIDVGSGEVIHEFELRCEQYLMESEAVPSAGCTIARGGREWDLEFSSDGRLLAMADSYNDVMMVWDTDTGERIIADDLPGSNARTIQFSPDGEQSSATSPAGSTTAWAFTTWDRSTDR
jgi:WD40 repeat protein